jgi:hypothetical protein
MVRFPPRHGGWGIALATNGHNENCVRTDRPGGVLFLWRVRFIRLCPDGRA